MSRRKDPGPFRFKRFSVCHSRSSMRVGVDGVLIGAWASLGADFPSRILDAGCGCGLIALMMAQRFPQAIVDAVDIHEDSVAEAGSNFNSSSWSDRLNVYNADLSEWCQTHSQIYDLIVSNPPFFDDGVASPSTSRELARHQDSLSPAVLISLASKVLIPGGRLALVAPASMMDDMKEQAREVGLKLERYALVRGTPHVSPKRVLVQWQRLTVDDDESDVDSAEGEEIVIETAPCVYTDGYKALTLDFYLKF